MNNDELIRRLEEIRKYIFDALDELILDLLIQ